MTASAPPGPIPTLDTLDATITTPRLVLRPLEPRHAGELFPYASDPDVARTMSWNAHADLDETREWVDMMIRERAKQTELVWAIEHAGKAIGAIGLGRITWTFRAWRVDRAELGYWLGKPFWRQGMTGEAALAVTAWAFETMRLHKIMIGCIDGNIASQKIIEKLGYRFLAMFEDDVWRDERWWNHRRYELTSAEWRDVARTQRFRRPNL
ncbi:MAG TPA: GNAT family N-acetyltransferase [Kofleriaceae bacterium]|jgi:ribosomal-protein-alanine N-acetyltransferase|nr:GNAT family N-acetyltransferase [Kofleriaceae bacterium]